MAGLFNKAKIRNNKVSAVYCEYWYLGIAMFVFYIIIAAVVNQTTDMDLYINLIVFMLFFFVTFVFLWGTSFHYVINDRYVFSRNGMSFNRIKMQDIHFCTFINNHITLYRTDDREIRLDFSKATNSDVNLFLDTLRKHNIRITYVQTNGHGNPVSFPWDEFIMRKTLAFPEYMSFIIVFIFIALFLSSSFEEFEFTPRRIGLLILSLICVVNCINAFLIRIQVSHDGIRVKSLFRTKYVPFSQISNAKTQEIAVRGFERMQLQVEAIFLYHDDMLIKIPCKITRYYTNYDLLITSLHNHGIKTAMGTS